MKRESIGCYSVFSILKKRNRKVKTLIENLRRNASPDGGIKGNKKIIVLGDFNPQYYTHLALNDAIRHLSEAVKHAVAFEWADTDKLDFTTAFISTYSGLWVAPGSPYKDMDNVINAIRFAREHNIPVIGNCGGFQHMLIEYARNVCGLEHADTEETHPDGVDFLISKLTCSLVGQKEEISIDRSSFLYTLAGKDYLTGKYHCSYALNPDYIPLLKSFGLKITATNTDGLVRAFELPTHPFFVGTLFQPALTSTADQPDPILLGFVKSVNCEL